MITNKVFITDKMIKFSGFELLNGKITISLLYSGTSISPGYKKDKLPHYYECILDEQKRTYDKNLIRILRERGLKYETQFVCINSNHYVELPFTHEQ